MSRFGPSKLTPEVEERILLGLSTGLPQPRVCELLGVTERALQYHCKKHPAFFASIKEAKYVREMTLVTRLESGAPGWQASAWLLSRIAPQSYGRKVEEHAPPVPPVKIITSVVDRENIGKGQGQETTSES